jgi:predicted secreted protein
MMTRKLIFLAVLALLISPLWAGDTAVFVDLGFSADGKTYSFGQYGVNTDNLRPWAELIVVDASSNNFVPGGRVSYVHDSPVVPGHDGAGALYRVISRNAALTDRYNIGYLFQGHPLYFSLENGELTGNDTIEFRNFEKAESFRATITTSGYGSAGGSSFFICLERKNSDGSVKTFTVGNAGIKRPGIVSYRIRRVLAGPRSASLVFVIEMKKQNANGSIDIRYMVETLKL